MIKFKIKIVYFKELLVFNEAFIFLIELRSQLLS